MYITQCEGCETGESDGVLPKRCLQQSGSLLYLGYTVYTVRVQK